MACLQTQGFYDNKNNIYASMGLKAHSGIDVMCGYGTDIEFPLDGIVSNVLDDKHPAVDGYWGVYAVCQYKGQNGELCVGHCSKINVKVGDIIKKGQVVGQEGNHGLVFQNGVKITLEQQAKGDKDGSHRHWQWRPLLKQRMFDRRLTYITTWGAGPYKDKDGFYYPYKDPNNGYNGLSPDIKDILDDYELDKKILPMPKEEILAKIDEAQRTYFSIALSWAKMQLGQLLDKLK